MANETLIAICTMVLTLAVFFVAKNRIATKCNAGIDLPEIKRYLDLQNRQIGLLADQVRLLKESVDELERRNNN